MRKVKQRERVSEYTRYNEYTERKKCRHRNEKENGKETVTQEAANAKYKFRSVHFPLRRE